MKKFAVLLVLVLMMTLCCSAVAESISIAVVYSDTVKDQGWCQSMHSGMESAIAKGYDIDYTPFESVHVSDAPNTLSQLAGSYDIIIVHGAQFIAATTEIAAEYPEQIFAMGTSDGILGDNIFTYMPMSEEPGYINGIIAAMTTKTNKVGIVGPTDSGDSARYIRGFIKALADTKPEVEYMLSWTGSFSDTVGAGAIGKTFIEAGCDVLVGPSQQAVAALRNVDAAEGVTWIGQTASQIVDFPGCVSAAADYDYSGVIIQLIERAAQGKKGGESIPLSYKNGGFVYIFSDHAELMPGDVRAAAQAALDGMTAQANTVDFSGVTLE